MPKSWWASCQLFLREIAAQHLEGQNTALCACWCHHHAVHGTAQGIGHTGRILHEFYLVA